MTESQNQKEQRTTVDLIEELDREAPRYSELMLAVGFENTTVFICSNDTNRLQALNVAIAEGSEPIGFIGFTVNESRARFYSRVLKEYSTEDWAEGYLNKLIGMAAEMLKVTNFDSGSGWLN